MEEQSSAPADDPVPSEAAQGPSASRGRAPTIYDVARRAGVAPSTVSRAFARPGRVSFETAERIRADAARAFEAVDGEARLADVLVVHRHGRIAVGEPIMMVATAARHRHAAFQAADYLMDWLKSRAPFWKREIGPEGLRGWVSARDEDEAALGRW